MNRNHLIYSVILLGALLWCSAILLAPALAGAGTVSTLLYEFFQPVCHQSDARSFHLAGHPFAVCMRCSAIYFAFLFGVVIYPVVRKIGRPSIPHRRWLVIALAPMLLDVAAGFFGLHEITPLTRIISGAVFGLILPFYIVPAACEAASGFPGRSVALPSSGKDL